MVNTAMTAMPTTLVYIPYFALVERLSYHDLKKVKSASKLPISDVDLLSKFKENDQWN